MKVLHISHHLGCMRDHAYIYNTLGLQYKFWKFHNGLFKITKDLANTIWNERKNFFNEFDYIVTSDTAPLSRIFMENIDELRPKVIVWICNRFDYNMESDNSFYDIFNKVSVHHKDKFRIIGYSDFERIYCADKGIQDVLDVITPIGINPRELDIHIDSLDMLNKSYTDDPNSKIKYNMNSELANKVFIPIYGNDNLFFNLYTLLNSNNIECFNGGYSHPSDLRYCKLLVTFPDAYSKLITFETIQNEVVVFLPSEEFLIKLHPTSNNGRQYWFNNPFGNLNNETVQLCEWYRYKNCRVYFNSIEDLIHKIKIITSDEIEEKKKWCRIYGEEIKNKNLEKWKTVFTSTHS